MHIELCIIGRGDGFIELLLYDDSLGMLELKHNVVSWSEDLMIFICQKWRWGPPHIGQAHPSIAISVSNYLKHICWDGH